MAYKQYPIELHDEDLARLAIWEWRRFAAKRYAKIIAQQNIFLKALNSWRKLCKLRYSNEGKYYTQLKYHGWFIYSRSVPSSFNPEFDVAENIFIMKQTALYKQQGNSKLIP